MKITICSIIKNEHRYLDEWIMYHLKLGFDEIWLYEDYDSKSHVLITNKYKQVHLDNITSVPDININSSLRQFKLYLWFIKTTNSDWTAFIDIDEFIVTKDIKALLMKYKSKPGIILEWHNYGANGFIKSPAGDVMKNYTRPAKLSRLDKFWGFKSIVNIKNNKGFISKHEIRGGYRVKIGAHINHYITKSWEDWENRIWSKGTITPGHRSLQEFFEINQDLNLFKDKLILSSNLKHTLIKKLKIAVCAIAKNENLYIREWIEWYKKLGIDKIFLYDNNELAGERFEEVINDYIQSGFVLVIDKRGIEKGCVFNKQGINLQTLCYIDCYEEYGPQFDWMCFFDIDEFLNIKTPNLSLSDFLNRQCFSNYWTVLVSWEQYDDNNLLKYDPRPVTTRFTKRSKYTRHGIKSIVRCGGKILNKTLDRLIHSFTIMAGGDIYANGMKLDSTTLDVMGTRWWIVKDEYHDLCEVVLNHYKTKTLEEFLKRHVGRHWGTTMNMTKNAKTLEDCILDFFKYNEKTPMKLKLIDSYGENKTSNNNLILL